MYSVRAVEYLDPNGSIVASGLALANVIVNHLAQGEDVEVAFTGLKGLPSSYFNPILEAVRAHSGLGVLDTRLKFRFDSPAQEMVFQRSLVAFQTSAA